MPRVNPPAGMPPYHHRSLPGPGQGPVPPHGMMHQEVRDPYGPAMHPLLGHGPGPFPYDMLPPLLPLEVLEQKLVAQHGEMQKLAVENDRLAASHGLLRKELAAAQQELQRLQAQGDAAKAAEEQEMRGLLDKVGKMEADLKACDPMKVELQQAHAEVQNLVAVRQNMVVNVQKLSKDLQRNLGEAQQLPALMAERDAARQDYQHLRATYEYERKLRVDHSESLQTMKKNYDSMVTELEKLRTELRNAANLEKSGIMYNINIAQKDDRTSSHISVGQIAYDGGYGGAQARTTPTGLADPLSGSPAGTARSGLESSRGNTYDTSRVASISYSKAGMHDVSRGAAGYDSLKGAGYDALKAPAIGGQAVATAAHGSSAGYYGSNQATPPPYAWGQSASTYGSVQMPPSYASGSATSSYCAATGRPYGSAQALPSYGQTQAPSALGHTQLPSSYGLAQEPSPFAAAQGSSPYGLSVQPPAYGSGLASANASSNYGAPHGRK
ncbi:protein FLX-like 2 [Phragmites australis]|uniref:protein FLX-like 2 n=1 Tax=Phragmites australis TaxID=29695 RepID=UPI002D77F0ED|nr:protein FLX-like 2 [Phragmites australis]XP_062218442.1 protein FLX-like 2 [Phragmites australis]